jgi:UDP-N-acetylglucosamine--N-acetylmuramyl-(pentapeptide) pyrophosphoryl-undecaprenol N-acetylglucosamine transferase
MVARVCLVSGGTGGHLMPALVLARALRERGHAPLLVTEGRAVEREYLERETGDVEALGLGEGRPTPLRLPLWFLRATLAARRLLRERRVDSVVSTGGRASLPIGLAARSLGKPLFLLEQNAVAGRANRWLSRIAARVYLGLPGARTRAQCDLLTGTPLRPELYAVDQERARRALGLEAAVPVVLVTGGSQGAQRLNELTPAALCTLDRPLQVLHLAGPGRDAELRRRYAAFESPVRAIVRGVAMDMDAMLGAADLVVCRGGGTTVAELMASGRPSVVVPYPHHRDRQQLRNARVLADAGAAVVLEEPGLSVAALRATVGSLLDDPVRLRAMGASARRLCRHDPTATILADMQRHGGLR